MVTAIVDLGSNTIRLCVYEYDGKNMKSIAERKTMASLANFVEKKELSEKGIDRACEVLNEYKDILKNFQVLENDIHIFATASLRNIINTNEVIEKIKENTGYDVELLSGKEEAYLDFRGAIKLINNDNGVLVDIGGGSTEIIVFNNKEVCHATSMPIGSLNLYVKYVKKIIPKEKEREDIRREVITNLMELEIKPEKYKTMYGIGGSIRATRKLSNYIYNLPKENINIDVQYLSQILQLIKDSKSETINPILRNIPDRIHTIIPGLIILETIAEFFGVENIVVSKYGVREGYLFERIGNYELN